MPITPKMTEVAIALTFWGADTGTFPGSTSNTSLTTAAGTLCLNSLKFNGNEELKDFKCSQELISKMRTVGSAATISGQLQFKVPSNFLKKYQAEGPLCRMVITGRDVGSSSDDFTLDFKGIMKLPDINFLDNPGTIDFEILSYGIAPLLQNT